MIDNYDWDRLDGLGFAEEAKEQLKKACWKGYEAVGTKKKGGRTVPNCVPVKKKSVDHSEKFDLNKDDPINQMTGRDLPKAVVAGGGDLKNPQMTEGVPVRMPRSDVIKRAANKNGHLAMMASANGSGDGAFSESEDFSDPLMSEETNGAMALNQLRVMQEKIAILLNLIEPGDNLEPWMAAKLTMSSQNLASVADYARFGVEFTEEL